MRQVKHMQKVKGDKGDSKSDRSRKRLLSCSLLGCCLLIVVLAFFGKFAIFSTYTPVGFKTIPNFFARQKHILSHMVFGDTVVKTQLKQPSDTSTTGPQTSLKQMEQPQENSDVSIEGEAMRKKAKQQKNVRKRTQKKEQKRKTKKEEKKKNKEKRRWKNDKKQSSTHVKGSLHDSTETKPTAGEDSTTQSTIMNTIFKGEWISNASTINELLVLSMSKLKFHIIAIQASLQDMLLYVVTSLMSIFRTRTILFTISFISVSFLALAFFWYGLVYWLKNRADVKRRLKSQRAKEKALNQLQPASYRRKISVGSRSVVKNKSSSKMEVPDTTLTTKIDDVSSDNAPEEAYVVQDSALDSHLQTDSNPVNASCPQLQGINDNQVTPSLRTALLIVASRLTNTASLKLMTEMMLSEIIHGDSWNSEDIELARQHLMTTSMMTSQQHAELFAKVQDSEVGGKEEGSKEDPAIRANDKNGDESDNVKHKDKEGASLPINDTLNLVFNDLHMLHEKSIEKDSFLQHNDSNNNTPGTRTNLKNLELSAIYPNSAGGSPNVMNTPILLQQPRIRLSQRQLRQERALTESAKGSNGTSVKIGEESSKQDTELGDHLTPRDRSIDALAMSPIDSRRWSSNKKVASRIPSRLSVQANITTGEETDDVLGDMPYRAGLRRDSDMRRTSRRRLNVNPDLSNPSVAMANSGLLNSGYLGMNVSLAFEDGISLLNDRESKLRRSRNK